MARSQVGESAGRAASQQAGQALDLEQPGHLGRARLREGGWPDDRVEAVPRAGEAAEALDRRALSTP